MEEHGPLCVGIDPHRKNLHDWGYNIDAEGAELFAMRMLQGAQGRAAAVKFQMPMFERYGSKGFAALERALYAARQMDIITIVDCLRGGLPTTLSSIADAYLKPEGPMATDAITLLPYYGFHSLDGLVNDALNNGCGVFVASLTPNPEGAHLQSAIRQAGEYAGQTVAYGIAQDAQKYNAEFPGSMGSVGLIIGASIGKWMKEGGVDPAQFTGPILSPGYGWQGATDEDLKTVFAGTHGNVLVTVARSIAAQGPDIAELGKAVTSIGDEVRRAMEQAQHTPPHTTEESGEGASQGVFIPSGETMAAAAAADAGAAGNAGAGASDAGAAAGAGAGAGAGAAGDTPEGSGVSDSALGHDAVLSGTPAAPAESAAATDAAQGTEPGAAPSDPAGAPSAAAPVTPQAGGGYIVGDAILSADDAEEIVHDEDEVDEAEDEELDEAEAEDILSDAQEDGNNND